jgi:2-haloacid dehalogenase
VPEALQALAGRPLAILSNGTPGMLQALLEHAGLGGVFTAVLSADAVQTYKPSPSVYELAPVHLGIDAGRIGFVSSNSFDVIGRPPMAFGASGSTARPPRSTSSASRHS